MINVRFKLLFKHLFVVSFLLVSFGSIYTDDGIYVKRVGVALFTVHPLTKKPIIFVSTAHNPHFASEGYTFCFPGIRRNENDSWEHNAAQGFNEKTFYFFARKFDDKKELFFQKLYSSDEKICGEFREKAHQIIANKLKAARFIQYNEHSRLYFLYIPYENFDAELSSELIYKQSEQVKCRFKLDCFAGSHDNSIRPGKYFKWVKTPLIPTKLELAFDEDACPRDLWLFISPFEMQCSLNDKDEFLST